MRLVIDRGTSVFSGLASHLAKARRRPSGESGMLFHGVADIVVRAGDTHNTRRYFFAVVEGIASDENMGFSHGASCCWTLGHRQHRARSNFFFRSGAAVDGHRVRFEFLQFERCTGYVLVAHFLNPQFLERETVIPWRELVIRNALLYQFPTRGHGNSVFSTIPQSLSETFR